jgi:23S rRNA (uracil1939-C5)-methyltransferase
VGERLKVKAARMAPEGEAIALEEGSPRVIFVPHAVPGDVLEVEVTEAKSSFARAKIRALLSPGAERISPPCSLHFDPARRPEEAACGGCDWQQLRYEAQLKYKKAIVEDCLTRIGKLRDVPVESTLPSPLQWRYRNKVQIPFGPGMTAGFYAAGSHKIVDFADCPVQPELAVRTSTAVKKLARELGWQPYEEDRGRGWLRHLYLRTNWKGQALAALVTRTPDVPKQEEFVAGLRAAVPELVGLHQNVQPLKTSVILGDRWRHIWGQRQLEEKIGKWSFMVSPGAFLQVNTGSAEQLYDAALAHLKADGAKFDAVLDLYCGVGTLTIWLSGAAPKVFGVEENREAVKDAWANAKRNNVQNARFWAGRTEAVLPRLGNELPARCAAVVDPPRMGLSTSALRLLCAPRFKRLVYVSCNPATFARDAAALCKAGYQLKKVQPVDLFPQTSHVELAALLDRP